MRGHIDLKFGVAAAATGGAGGFQMVARTTDELIALARRPDAGTIYLASGTHYEMKGRTIRVTSNKTIIGGVGSTIVQGSVRVEDARNVVLYHFRCLNPVGDGIVVRNSDLVHISWVTVDGKGGSNNKAGGKQDGAIDIVDSPSSGCRVTIAYCRVLRWHKAFLIGWSKDTGGTYDDRIRVTIYCCRIRANRRIPQVNRARVQLRSNWIRWRDQCSASYRGANVWHEKGTIEYQGTKSRPYCGEFKDGGRIGFSGNTYIDCRWLDKDKEDAKIAKMGAAGMPRQSKAHIKANAGYQHN